MNQTDPNPPPFLTPKARWRAFLALLIGMAVNMMDIMFVSVALPSIQPSLNADPERIGWVPGAYILAFALALLPFGRMGDIHGRKKVFLWGTAAFTLTALLCALAPSFEFLVVGRALQGFAGAALVAQVMAIIPALFPPEERGRAYGVFATITSLAAVSGPLLGGLLVSASPFGLGWRTIFLADAALALAVLVTAARTVPSLSGQKHQSSDKLSILLFGLTILCLIPPLFEGPAQAWPRWTITLIVLALPLALAFVLRQRHQAKVGGPELLPFALLRTPAFLAGLGLIALTFSGPPGLFLVLSLALQTGLGMTAALAGLTTVPFPVGVMIGSLVTARIARMDGRPRIAAGGLILALGLIGLRLVLADIVAGEGARLLPMLLLSGFGMGLTAPALFQYAMSSVPTELSGAGSGALQTFQQIGAATGIAISMAIFTAATGSGTNHAAAAAITSGYQITVFTVVTILTATAYHLSRRKVRPTGASQ